MTQGTPPVHAPIRDDSFDAIIFDLGGVILPLYPERTVARLEALFGKGARAAYTQAAQSPVFDQLERGELSPAEFRSEVCRTFGKEVPDDDFDSVWNAMLGSLPSLHLDFLFDLSQKKRTFLLSNTNEIHITRFLSDFAHDHPASLRSFADHFEAVHYSHDLKMRKPEPRIFEALIEKHRLTPGRTIFLDDNLQNVAAARTVGLLGVHHPTNAPLVSRFTPAADRRFPTL